MSDALSLMPGDWVEVRAASEILATLDEHGCVEGLPFMPEMLVFCGRRFRVYRRADKTCLPYPGPWQLRRMTDTVHLALLRCSGEAHGGCQNGCLLFWKEIWLTRVECGEKREQRETTADDAASVLPGPIVDRHQLEQTTRQPSPQDAVNPCYRCQATEVGRATSPLPWWEPRQYWRDMRVHGVTVGRLIRGFCQVFVFRACRYLKLPILPNIRGKLTRTPAGELNLQAGDLVEVKTVKEILATLDGLGRNRGMSFDRAMLPYCGKRFRVLRRVERTLNEVTGQIIHMKTPGIILNDVVCTGEYHRFCPRNSFPFWREIWLRRVKDSSPEVGSSS
jgi:hypothetical protein